MNHFLSNVKAQTDPDTGVSPGFGRGGGGARIFYFRFGNLHVAKLGGFGGMPPPPRENFYKWCNLVRFGVYFDQILSLKFFKNYHFYIKNLKIAIFYIKE